jgi:hypothetical protein
MRVQRLRGLPLKLPVERSQILPVQKPVRTFNLIDPSQPHLFDQPVL